MSAVPKVLVLGELNVDIILTGEDILPEWNKEKLADTFQVVPGSSSAITACGLAGLGLAVKFVGVVGDDEYGRLMKRTLDKFAIETDALVVEPTIQTGLTISLSSSRDRALVTYMGSIPLLKPADLPEDLLDGVDHVHFGSYFLLDGMREHWLRLFSEAQRRGASTSFDTGWDPRGHWQAESIGRLLEVTDLFIPSEEELLHIFPGSSVSDSAAKLPSHRYVGVKCGAKGGVLFDAHGVATPGAPFPVQPIDTTGAGDSFNAGLIYAYLHGMEPTEMIRFANACGALATQRVGGIGSMPGLDEIRALLGSIA
ncbi:carbohydrate kinase family protein [Paenibacillus koleovorans]|uniref:carbohydrate kinase family protein n=1 Tax=Paenibacillus koleovorans TaxID=121608 RepID=UPI000FDC7FAF|nr:carbohydrate kinase family protein [Paenibacillus koleovorans]